MRDLGGFFGCAFVPAVFAVAFAVRGLTAGSAGEAWFWAALALALGAPVVVGFFVAWRRSARARRRGWRVRMLGELVHYEELRDGRWHARTFDYLSFCDPPTVAFDLPDDAPRRAEIEARMRTHERLRDVAFELPERRGRVR